MPVEVWSQIAIFVAIVEGLRSQIIFKPDAVPGDHGFDPLGFKPKSSQAMKEMQLKELKNGRLAMVAITGIVAQGLITGKGPIEQLF